MNSNFFPNGPSVEQQAQLDEARLGPNLLRSNWFPNGPTPAQQAVIDDFRKSIGTPFPLS